MSVQQLPARRSPLACSPCTAPRVSLPTFPDSAHRPGEDASDLPLPDHFPEPYRDDHPGHHHHGFPSTAPVMMQSGVKQPVMNHTHDAPCDDAKEGVRRITDKYAAPSMLHVNGSVCSSDNYSTSSMSPVETWSASTPSSTSAHHSSSPTPSSGFSNSPVMNGRNCAVDLDGTLKSCGQSLAGQQQEGRGSHHKLAPLSISSAFSDVSSDMSDASPSPALTVSGRSGGGLGGMGVGSGRYQSVSGIALSTSLGDGVTVEDVQQVEMFYRSHKSEVTACRCLANLYFASVTHGSTATPAANSERLSSGSAGELWEFVTTGIPLLVLDSGDHHRARQLSLVVAEKGTGFVLWKDVVSHLTCYACPAANFHTLYISSDGGNKLAGLSFDDSKAAAEFSSTLLKLTSDPDDELLMLSQKGKKKKKKKKDSGKNAVKFRPPRKSDISQPCCFQHITKLERPQLTGLTPLLPSGVPPAPGGGSVSSLTEMLHDRLTVTVADRARSASSELSDLSAEQ